MTEVVNQVMFCFENDAPAETLARLSYMAATPAERQALDKKIKDTVTDASAMRSFAAIKKVVNENFSDDKSRRFAQDALEGFQKCDQELVEVMICCYCGRPFYYLIPIYVFRNGTNTLDTLHHQKSSYLKC